MSNKRLAISGAKWTTFSTLINTILQFGQVAILARLLDPSSFGIVSVNMLLITFLGIFAHFGFSNSIVYKQESDRRVLSTIYGLNLIIGFGMFFVIFFASPLLVMYYKEPRLLEVLRLSAFYFPIVFLGQIYGILLEMNLRFKAIAVIEIVSAIIGTSTTIVFAYNGFEAKSLIIGLLTAQSIKVVAQNIVGRKMFSPQLFFNLRLAKDHLRFGIVNIGDSLLGFANSNMDTIIIGGLLGVKELGYYTIAAQIAIYPVARICPLILQICYPIMAKMNENVEQLKRAYLQIVDFLSFCNIPLLIGLFMVAGNVVPLIYGEGWEPTVPLIKIFIFTSIFSCLAFPLSTVAYSRGKPSLLFYLSLVTLAIKFPLIYVFARMYGIYGIAYGILISSFVSLMLNFFFVHQMVGSYFKSLMKNLFKPAVFSLIMSLFIITYKEVVGNEGLMHTLIQILIGGAVYGILTLKFKIGLSEIRSLRKAN